MPIDRRDSILRMTNSLWSTYDAKKFIWNVSLSPSENTVVLFWRVLLSEFHKSGSCMQLYEPGATQHHQKLKESDLLPNCNQEEKLLKKSVLRNRLSDNKHSPSEKSKSKMRNRKKVNSLRLFLHLYISWWQPLPVRWSFHCLTPRMQQGSDLETAFQP